MGERVTYKLRSIIVVRGGDSPVYFRPLKTPSNSIGDPSIGCGNWRHRAKRAPGEVGGNAGPHCPSTSGSGTSRKSRGCPPGLLPAPGPGAVGRSSQITFLRWVDREREMDSRGFGEISKSPCDFNTLANTTRLFPQTGSPSGDWGKKKIPNTFTFGKLKGLRVYVCACVC